MTSLIRANLIRGILLIVIQFILKEVDYVNIDIYIYPLFILLLPVGILDAAVIFISFIYGLCIDTFYNTAGLYASAAVFIATIRPIVLSILEPRGGFDAGKAPSKENFGLRWFAQYSGVMIFLHTLWIITLEELSLFSWIWILRLIVIFALSMLMNMLYQFIFNPKE